MNKSNYKVDEEEVKNKVNLYKFTFNMPKIELHAAHEKTQPHPPMPSSGFFCFLPGKGKKKETFGLHQAEAKQGR